MYFFYDARKIQRTIQLFHFVICRINKNILGNFFGQISKTHPHFYDVL